MNKNIIIKLISGTLLCSIIGYTMPVFAYTKDETVYSKLDSSGSCYKTIVSTHIENSENEDFIKDVSDLLNIKNTSGEETFSQDGNIFTWNANKNDIYYQGDSSKELPIECSVKYELNGEEVLANELAGKSGKVKVTLHYTNKEERIANINGKDTEMYVPFVIIAGTVIKNECASNIQISSGKVIDDGTKNIVVGMAMPGLQESLGLVDDEIYIPNDIVITMDVNDFESNSIVSFITPKVLEEEDLIVFDKLDEVYSKVNTLQSSYKKIEDGANNLKNGAVTYSDKSKEFNGAINKVYEGVSSVNSNYSKIDSGISSLNSGSLSLTSGAIQLNFGINELSNKLSSMPESVSHLYQGSVTLNSGVNGENGLKNGVNTIKTSLSTTIQTLNSNVNTLKNTKSQLLTAGYIESDEIIVNLQKQISVDSEIISQLSSAEAQAKLTALDAGINAISTGTQALEKGLGELNSASSQLPNALTQLSTGSKSLVTGSKSLQSGVSTLSKGSSDFKAGVDILDSSTKVLTCSNGQLTEGAVSLAEGASVLADGIGTFNKEGIKKICDYINGDIGNLVDRVNALSVLSEEYDNFTLLSDDQDGNVKFIIIVDGVKKQQESEQKKEHAIVKDKFGN